MCCSPLAGVHEICLAQHSSSHLNATVCCKCKVQVSTSSLVHLPYPYKKNVLLFQSVSCATLDGHNLVWSKTSLSWTPLSYKYRHGHKLSRSSCSQKMWETTFKESFTNFSDKRYEDSTLIPRTSSAVDLKSIFLRSFLPDCIFMCTGTSSVTACSTKV